MPVQDGEQAAVREIEIRNAMTKPPARYNEATLLAAMEGAGKLVHDEELAAAMSERGLGTPATRASIIEGLISQEYIARDGRDLLATHRSENSDIPQPDRRMGIQAQADGAGVPGPGILHGRHQEANRGDCEARP